MTSSERASSDLVCAKQELERLIGLMGMDASVEAFIERDEEILLHVESEDAGRLIGRGASMLDALQYILNRVLYQKDSGVLHCIVDVERYKERKKDRLIKEAYEAADKAERTGRSVSFSSMGASDRRIIHQALKHRKGVETHSEESRDKAQKYVVVSLVEDHQQREVDEPELEEKDEGGNLKPEFLEG